VSPFELELVDDMLDGDCEPLLLRQQRVDLGRGGVGRGDFRRRGLHGVLQCDESLVVAPSATVRGDDGLTGDAAKLLGGGAKLRDGRLDARTPELPLRRRVPAAQQRERHEALAEEALVARHVHAGAVDAMPGGLRDEEPEDRHGDRDDR
jgi:hypothetical protein